MRDQRLIDGFLEALASEIRASRLAPEILGSDWLARGRFLKAFDPVMTRTFRRLGLRVRSELDNPFVRAWRRAHPSYRLGQQRADYALRREGHWLGFAELESLDRAQVMTFKCQYHDWDNGKRDYYWATVDHLTSHPVERRPEFFLFVLALPDFPVKPYTIWDVCDEYYEVSTSDRATIFRSPYRFYDHRIGAASGHAHEQRPRG